MATATTKKDKVAALTERLEEALRERYETSQRITRTTDGTVALPEYMTPEDGAKMLLSYAKEREETVQSLVELTCHRDDGLVAFYNAMSEQFGKLLSDTNYSWFGPTPGRSLRIQIDFDKTVTIPIANVKVPGIPIELKVGFEENEKNPMASRVFIQFEYKRMWEPFVKDIEENIRRWLRENSIFKGKAIDSRFNFLNLRAHDTKRLVYSKKIAAEVNAYIKVPIRDYNDLKKEDFQMKRTILLSGPYGTGKTLTALDTAKFANKNGWTFFLVRTGDSIVTALEFAKKFQPCVVFFEDVEMQAGGNERTTDLNAVLNEIDGLDKGAEVMLLLTTNHPENISKAMFRPGRIDKEISMGHMDAACVADLVRAYASHQIKGDLNPEELFEAARDYPHAFVVGAAKDAMLFARHNDTRDDTGELYITNDDVVGALQSLRPMFERMNGIRDDQAPTVDSTMSVLVDERVNQHVEQVNQRVEDLEGWLKKRLG